VTSECCHGEEEKWKMVDVHGLHRPKQMLPKDNFPLARIDQVVDTAAGSEMMTYLAPQGRRRKEQLHHSAWDILLS
jgi:hypothetical protein